MKGMEVDELDKKILKMLKKDGRASLVDIAEKLKVPRPTVYLRVNTMKKRGVIKGFSVILDEKDKPLRAAFLKIKGYMLSKMTDRITEDVASKLAEKDDVLFVGSANKGELFVMWKGNEFNPLKFKNVKSMKEVSIHDYKHQ